MVATCSCGVLGGSIGSLNSPMCSVQKFFKMFTGHLKKIWDLFLGSPMRVGVFKAVLWPLKTFQGSFRRFLRYFKRF